ncbi:hypothetical protein DL93DRAFT_2098005 [Clavulina sp. PMI_390]|nr:hypothetical protein DL93DRAFT_2098005 [Clavulina sp. PMI_390]
MPRLTILAISARGSEMSPITLFTDSSSPATLHSIEITGAAVAPSNGRPPKRLSISDAISQILSDWILPLIESWNNLTSLSLDTDALGSATPSSRVLLPRLKYLSQTSCSAEKYLEMPVLERLTWNRMRFRDDGESCSLPSLKALSIRRPQPDAINALEHGSIAKFDLPLLEELEVDGACALALLPRLVIGRSWPLAESVFPGVASFPNLRQIGLRETCQDNLDGLRAMLITMLRRHPPVCLHYQEGKTWPKDDDFWAGLKSELGNRLVAHPQSEILLPYGPNKL